MRQWVLVLAAAVLVVLGAWGFSAAAQQKPASPTFSGQWLVEFPKDTPKRSYSCAVYQYARGYKVRLICTPVK
ncbi:MAG TPA: hypothetical protein VGA35_09145 [bacterium]